MTDTGQRYIGGLIWHHDAAERTAMVAETTERMFVRPQDRVAFETIMEACSGDFDMTRCVVDLGEAAAQYTRFGSVKLSTLKDWLDKLKLESHTDSLGTVLTTAQQRLDAGHDPSEIETELSEARVIHTADYGRGGITHISEHVDEFIAWSHEIEERRADGTDLKFGLPAIDQRAMLVPGMGVILARTSHGKTATMLTLAYNQARMGRSPLIFSLEQPARMAVGRLVSIHMGHPLHVAASATLGSPMREQREQALKWVRQSNITIYDKRHTVEGICATAHRMVSRGQCDVVYVDQMSRIDHRERKGENKEQAWTRTSNRLSELWKDISVPVILLAQLRGKLAVEHSAPAMSHVKDCGSLLEDACWVWVLDRIEADEDRLAKAEKHREKLAEEGNMQASMDVDVRGKLWIGCTKDRNSTMGGTWNLIHRFDANSGTVTDTAHRRVASEVSEWAGKQTTDDWA